MTNATATPNPNPCHTPSEKTKSYSSLFVLGKIIAGAIVTTEYTVRLKKKSLHFSKFPHINISKYFQEMFIHVGSYGSPLSYYTEKSWRYCMLEWAGATFVKLTKIKAWQELVFVLAAISKIESWKGFKFFLFWWSDDNLWSVRLCCVYILT